MNSILKILLILVITVYSLSIKAQEDLFNFQANVKTITLEQGSFSVFDYGSGPTVLLLHGSPDTKEVCKNQVVALENAGYRAIAPDLRGRGPSWSPLEVENYTLDKLQQDVLGIMDALDIEKAHLVTHDWGSVIGCNLAGMQPERFHTLTVVSIGHFSSPAYGGCKEMATSWYIYLFLREGLAEQTLAS